MADKPLIAAHRGASAEAPENTIASFMLAWKQGADAIEGDFRLSRDGHIVCIHDANTARVSSHTLAVNESTMEKLKSIDVGSHKGAEFRNETIPAISEVFSAVPEGKKIFIEVKSGTDIIPPLLPELEASELAPEQTLIISFNMDVIRQIKARAPHLSASWLCSFKKDSSGTVTPSLKTVITNLKEMHSDGLSSNTDIPEEFAGAILEEGYAWHVWTIDDAKTAKHMLALGARSITTNRPGYMKQKLKCG